MAENKLSDGELQKKFADLLEKHGSLIVTEDGQAFLDTAEGSTFATSHCAKMKVTSKVLKAAKKEETQPEKKSSGSKKKTK